jgi:cyclic dehypoxanthinyl futalosine synthase
LSSTTADAVLERVAAGEERLSDEAALDLFDNAPTELLGAAAHAVRTRLHPEPILTCVVDRNVNYTNVCVVDCDFCAFYRRPRDSEAYVLSREQIHQKLQELVDAGGTQVLMQGGHHPRLKLDWYLELLADIKAHFPLHLHAFSPPEIFHFTKVFKLPVKEVLRQFQAAGLDSVPGGGGEILADRVRKLISPKKVMADDWLGVMRAAHELGMKTSATMMFGHVETSAERVETLRRYRELQDQTGGFIAFICWGCQPSGTPIEECVPAPIGAVEYLRTVAISRIYLDNIPNIQASWVTLGPEIGQVSMQYGCNDWGGTMLEENVVSQAGTVHHVGVEDMRRMSTELGYQFHKRDHFYNLLS